MVVTSVAELNYFSSVPAPGKKNFAPASAPPIKTRLRPAPLQKTDFDTKHLKNLTFAIKKLQKTYILSQKRKTCTQIYLLSLSLILTCR